MIDPFSYTVRYVALACFVPVTSSPDGNPSIGPSLLLLINLASVDLGRKPQRAERLPGERRAGREVDKHERLGVAPETGLEEVGELGVAEGDVLLLVRKGHDDVPCKH